MRPHGVFSEQIVATSAREHAVNDVLFDLG